MFGLLIVPHITWISHSNGYHITVTPMHCGLRWRSALKQTREAEYVTSKFIKKI